jgi:hypothetical protein
VLNLFVPVFTRLVLAAIWCPTSRVDCNIVDASGNAGCSEIL